MLDSDEPDDEIPPVSHSSSRRVRFHGDEEDADASINDRTVYYTVVDRDGSREISPPRRIRVPEPPYDAERVREREAGRPRLDRYVSDSSVRDHSQERVRHEGRRARGSPFPRRSTSGYFSPDDAAYEVPEDDGIRIFPERGSEYAYINDAYSPTSPYDISKEESERWIPRYRSSTPRVGRSAEDASGHGFGLPTYPDLNRGMHFQQFYEKQAELQDRLAFVNTQLGATRHELADERVERLESKVRRTTALLIREKQLSALLSEKMRCEADLKEHTETAGSLDEFKTRLQGIVLAEEDILQDQARLTKDNHSETDRDETGPHDRTEQLQHLTYQLLALQSQKDHAQQRLRSAETAKGAVPRLTRELNRLEEDVKEARYREANSRIAAQDAQDEDIKNEETLRRRLAMQTRERDFLIQELELLQRERLHLEQGPLHVPPIAMPQRPPVIIRNRSGNDRIFLSSRASSENPSWDDKDAPNDSASSVSQTWPFANENRFYNDQNSDEDTLANVSYDKYESDGKDFRPRRTYNAVEKEGLSVSFPLNKGVRAILIQDGNDEDTALTSEAKAWKEDKTILADGISSTELRVIHAAEYSEDELGIGKTTLMCLDGPREQESLENAQMRWLHVQQPSLKFKTLENIVVNCSHIDNDLRRIAVEAMEKVKDQFSGESECGAFLEPGSILRYIGEREDAKSETADCRYTEPVVFLSSPFLTLQPFSSRRASKFEYRPRSLLQSLYGYDVGSERESGQVVQKLGISNSRKHVLHINQLWCLIIGSKVLITMSEQSSAQLRGDSIVMNPRNSSMKEPLLVRLTDKNEREYRTVVERDCNYVDFLTLAVARVAGQDADASRWDLFDESSQILTPDRWIEILSSTDNKMCAVSVVEKCTDDSDSEVYGRKGGTSSYALKSHRIRSAPNARRALSSVSRSLSRRRTRSENDLKDRRGASRPRSSHGSHSYSHLVASRSRSHSHARNSWSPHVSGSHGPYSYSYGSRSLVSRRKSRDPEYGREALDGSAGALVPCRRSPQQFKKPSESDGGPHSSKTDKSPESTATDANEGSARAALGEARVSRDKDSPGTHSPSRLHTEHEDFVRDETHKVLQEHDWSHLSDIPEERSSSAPTPNVGTAAGQGDSTSSSEKSNKEDEEVDVSETTGQDKDPRNMQMILRPKGPGLEEDSSSRMVQALSSQDDDIAINISRPWWDVGESTALRRDELPVYGFPDSSGLGRISPEVETSGSAKQRTYLGLSPAEEALRDAGADLHALYVLRALALRLEDYARASDVQYVQIPDQELLIQQLLRAAAALPEEWEIHRELQAATRCIEELRRRQQDSDYEGVDDARTPMSIIRQEKIIRRLQLIKKARMPAVSSSADSKIAEVQRQLEDLRSAYDLALDEGDHIKAADLSYDAISNKEQELQRLMSEDDVLTGPAAAEHSSQLPSVDSDKRPLNPDSVLHWAHGRGHFSVGFGHDPVSTDPQAAEPGSGSAANVKDEERHNSGPSGQNLNRTNSVTSSSNEKSSSSHSDYHDRSERDLDEGIDVNKRSTQYHSSSPTSTGRSSEASSQYYRGTSSHRPRRRRQETPSRRGTSTSRSRHRGSFSNTSSSSSQISDDFLSDDEPLAPGVILNELPRPQKSMPEVYDPEEIPRTSAPEIYVPSDEESEVVSLSDSGSGTMEGVDRSEKAKVKSYNTSKSSTSPTVTEFFLWPSAHGARRFKRRVLRRYAPTAENDSSVIELAAGTPEVVEDEEADGPFDKGCRIFYRKEPKPLPGEEADWTDEYVIDFRDLPFLEHSMFTLPIEWPPLPGTAAEAKASKPRTSSPDPFLRWRVKSSDEDRSPEEVDKSVLKILGSVDESLQTGDFGDMYPPTFMCTLREIYERYDFLTSLRELEEPVLQEAGADDSNEYGQSKDEVSKDEKDGIFSEDLSLGEEKAGVKEAPEASRASSKDTSAPRRRSSKTSSPQQDARRASSTSQHTSHGSLATEASRQNQSMGALSHEQSVLKNLLDVSKALLAAYMPADGSPLFNSVCQRYWGCVDDIFRQVIWQMIESSRAHGGETYIIRDFDFPSSVIERAQKATNQKSSWSSCQHCKTGRHYATVREALLHLHTAHFDCPCNVKQPYDDPCFVWLRQLGGGRLPSVLTHLNVAQVEDFVIQLLLISRYSQELHNLVASIHGSDTKSRPQLPANIVLAFEQIMGMYMAQAQRLSLSNRRGARSLAKPPSRKVDRQIDIARARGERARQAVMEHLTEAKKDIILLRGTSRQIDSLSVEAVGAEFLVLSLMTNIQNRPILNKPAPYNPEKADFLELYRRYTSSLRFQANRRPKKRVFLDIHGLEEELDALRSMVEAQLSLNCNYLRLLDPGSTRATNATRVGQYKIERAYVRKQERNLDAKLEGIHVLREKSEVLKEQVKKTIEVLEEDHGKAIRVFTFVTLLFLPLSFVTSFMGMNTTDIRDTEWSQQIFWATGLPVTLVVVILALIYAYRGERIQDWVLTNMRPRKRQAGRSMGGSFAWSGELPEGDTFLVRGGSRKREPVHVDSKGILRSSWPYRSEPEWIRDAKERLKRAKQKSRGAEASGMRRRRTGQSLAR